MADYGQLLFQPQPRQGVQPSTRPQGVDYGALLFGGPQAQQTTQRPKRDVPFGEAAAQGFIDFSTADFGDEAEAKLRSRFGGEDYDAALADVRERQAASGNVPYYLGAAAGLLTPGGLVAGASRAGKALYGVAGKYLGAAGAGAAEGAAAAMGRGEGSFTERLPEAPMGAAIGAPLGVVGQKAGDALVGVAERRLAKDINRLDPAQVADLQRKASEQGIQLTPAELTNLASLKTQQKAVGNLPQSADDMDEFYRRRAETQIAPAVEGYLERISPDVGLESAGEKVRAAARAGMEKIAANRAAQASPLYQKAFAEAGPVDVAPVLEKIEGLRRTHGDKGRLARALTNVEGLLTREGPGSPMMARGAVPDWAKKDTRRAATSLDQLHSAKVQIDDLIDAAKADAAKGGKTELALLTGLQQDLVKQMDAASPDYQAARAIFSDLSPGVDRVREGVAGVIANLPDTNLRHAASKLFGKDQVGTRSAIEAKKVIQAADPDAWQSVKRAFLEDAWIKAGKETLAGGPVKVSRGATWRKNLFGDIRQRQTLMGVLEPDEFKALDDLSSVLEASGRVKPLGSDTAWNQEAMKSLRSDTSGVITRLMRGFRIDAPLKELADTIDERRFASRAQDLARIITSPEGMQLMRELKRLPAHAQFKRAVLGQALAVMGREALQPEGEP